jgi:arginine/lysine/histidine/glutamine transport system substrate-binding/permease protein
MMDFFLIIFKAIPNLLLGAIVTIELTTITVGLGVIGGTLLALSRFYISKPFRWLVIIYIDFFRGTPLLVQIFMIYFGLPALLNRLSFDINFNRLTAASLALSLNSSAYLAEIIRGGIQSIDLGQIEAAESLGMNVVQSMRHIIMPQALRRIIPPLGNEFITILKDTSLVAVIGFEELFRRGQLIVANNYRAFEIYTAVALIYLVLNIFSSRVFNTLEDWMTPFKNKESNH